MESGEPPAGGPETTSRVQPFERAGGGPPPRDAACGVRGASPADLPAVVEIHLATLPARLSDFTPLGREVVARFYERVLEPGAGDLLLAVQDGRVAGFTLITADVHDLFHRALLRGPGDVLFLLVKAPWAALFRALLGGNASVPHVTELVYLAVDPACQGRGHGRALLLAAEETFRRLGTRGYELNVRCDNAAAIRLYEACGLTVTRRFTRRRAPMQTMSKSW